MGRNARVALIVVVVASVIAAALTVVLFQRGSAPVVPTPGAGHAGADQTGQGQIAGAQTSSPIKHIVVLFQENVSFDHYFATYPHAANPVGRPAFSAAPGTPVVAGLNTAFAAPKNPNSVQPFRLDRTESETCDQDHGYAAEQAAFNGGKMNRFVENVGEAPSNCPSYGHGKGLTMGYYDGNTVTALWNYAQHFAMSDNSYGTTFGPSTPGALNLVSGQTMGFTKTVQGITPSGAIISDPYPAHDRCATAPGTSALRSNRNIGDLLNAKKVTWGWFQGGFANCSARHIDAGGVSSTDYVPHHEAFQYYRSTANPTHVAPASVAEIGHAGRANHQYDLTDFWAAVAANSMPAVSFLKAPAYEDGHPGFSTPLDEQRYLVDTINRLQLSPDWASMAIIVAYDDSDGWYDHVRGPVISAHGDRAGYGPRLPLLVISPYAKANFVDHTVTDQTSILRFIEDNWGTGRIGGGSYDALAGNINSMFDFTDPPSRPVPFLLDPDTGGATNH